MGECHHQLGNLSEAVKAFQKVLQVNSKDKTVKMLLAKVWYDMGELERATLLVQEGTISINWMTFEGTSYSITYLHFHHPLHISNVFSIFKFFGGWFYF